MRVVGVTEAASQLGVSQQRVRQLIQAGDLAASRVGGRWLIDHAELKRLASARRQPGRPFSAARAWALLAIAAGQRPHWLADGEVDRLAGLLAIRHLSGLAARLRHRAEVHRWYVHPSLVDRLADDDAIVIGGARAAPDLTADRGPLHVYVPGGQLDRLRAAYQPLDEVDDPNVIVRVVRGPWPFPADVRRAWPVVAALDLLDDRPDDPRSREVADQILATDQMPEGGWAPAPGRRRSGHPRPASRAQGGDW